MVDVVSPAKRSQMMSGIKGKNSVPEMLVRKALFATGNRFRLHRRDLPGTPDIVMPGRKIAIFVHGCFWHSHERCKYAKTPSTRMEFWAAKLQGNIERDRRVVDQLSDLGWRVLNVWECSTLDLKVASALTESLQHWINSDDPLGEISADSLDAARQPRARTRPRGLSEVHDQAGPGRRQPHR